MHTSHGEVRRNEALDELHDTERRDVLASSPPRPRCHPEMQDFEGVAHRALTTARAGAKVLVVRNTVTYELRVGDTERVASVDLSPL